MCEYAFILLMAMFWYRVDISFLFLQKVHFQFLNLKLNCCGLVKKEIKSTEINYLWNRFKPCKNYQPLASSGEGTIKFISQRLQNHISVSMVHEISALLDVCKSKESVVITKGISKQIKS